MVLKWFLILFFSLKMNKIFEILLRKRNRITVYWLIIAVTYGKYRKYYQHGYGKLTIDLIFIGHDIKILGRI